MPGNCWPTAPVQLATCSRIGCSTREQFLDAVKRVADGGTAMDPEVIAKLLNNGPANAPVARLTARKRRCWS